MSTDVIEFAPGVTRHVSYSRAVYTGSADALVAAGLAEDWRFPGQPGNARGMSSFDPQGERIQQGGATRDRTGPGHTRIVAKNDGRFSVEVKLSSVRLEAIEAEKVQASRCWPFPEVHGMAFIEMPGAEGACA